MGLSGSGKGTQAKILVEKFGFSHIVVSDLFREEISKKTKLGEKLNEIINIKSELVPDNIVFQLLAKKILDKDLGDKIIIDGYPRTLKQAQDLAKILKRIGPVNFIILHIKISDAEAIRRLSKRLVCQKCGKIYVEGEQRICSKCRKKLVKRPDDTPEKIKKRLKWAHTDVDPTIEFLKKQGKVVEINGLGSVTEVHQRIVKKLQKYL